MTGSGAIGWRRKLASTPVAPALAFALRMSQAARHLLYQLRISVRWLFSSRETTNFNYDLLPLNRLHLAWWVSEVAGAPVVEVLKYFDEVEQDSHLRAHIRRTTLNSAYRWISDPDPTYGRRLGWYALVRCLRPSNVVETGIDKGLGTCVLAAALLRNGSGSLTAVDVQHGAGWLADGPYSEVVTIVTGDAAEVIDRLPHGIDLLVHDVHHTSEQEEREYAAVLPKLTPRAVVMSDNAHSTDVLPRLAESLGWRFLYFQERPKDHWYPGAGMSAACLSELHS